MPILAVGLLGILRQCEQSTHMYMINHPYKHSHNDIGRALPENIWTGSSPVGRWILLFLVFIFYWSIVDLQCFWLLAKWFSYTYIHIAILFQILLLYRLLQGVKSCPLAIQKVLVVYLFYRQSYVSVHLKFQICPCPWRWLLQPPPRLRTVFPSHRNLLTFRERAWRWRGRPCSRG